MRFQSVEVNMRKNPNVEELAKSLRQSRLRSHRIYRIRHNYCNYSGHRRYKPWEDALILRGIWSQSEIAKFLHRSLLSVSRRMNRLRIMNLEEPMPNLRLSDAELVRHCRINSCEYQRRKRNGVKHQRKRNEI